MVGSDYRGDDEMTMGYEMRSALRRAMGSMMVVGRILSTPRDGRCILIESRLCSILTTNTAGALKALLPEGAECAFTCLDSVFYHPLNKRVMPIEGPCILVVSRLCSMLLLIQKEPSELYYIKVRKVHLGGL